MGFNLGFKGLIKHHINYV